MVITEGVARVFRKFAANQNRENIVMFADLGEK
jgi:hypothetical protein